MVSASTTPMALPAVPINAALLADIHAAIEALPPSYRAKPADGEFVENVAAGYVRCQDWAFTQGFALVRESGKPDRKVLKCVHHGKATRNTRKLEEEDRKRPWTTVLARDCKFTMYISWRKKDLQRAIGYTNETHNHSMNSDPFSCHQHRDRRVGHQRAIDIGRGLRGEVTWHKAKRILANHELRLDRKEWYNLNRKAQQQKLTEQEELLYQVEALVNEGFHVRTMEEYLVNDAGERTGHVIKCLYFCSGERIRLARRFVSGFIM